MHLLWFKCGPWTNGRQLLLALIHSIAHQSPMMVDAAGRANYYGLTEEPEWRNWYTHQTQNLARFTPRVGSSPTSGTSDLQAKRSQKDTETPRPPLKWAGGKRWLLPYLEPLWQKHRHRRYIEPFCGGLAMPLGLKPQTALLNDINQHLINFYQQVQNGLRITIETKNCEKVFYAHRKRFNQLIKQGKSTTAEAAQLFYYLNRTCFNGLCRFNRNGEFNVPFGKHKTINYRQDFRSYNTRRRFCRCLQELT